MFKKGNYIFYALANGMFYYSWGTFACIISVYLAGIGCSPSEISFITSASPLFAMATQPICGMIADKLKSPRFVGIGCLILSALSGFLFAYTHNFVLLFLFNGFAQGFLNGTTALSDRLATAAPYPFGTIRIWGSICYAVACQVTGFVYEHIAPIAIYYIFIIAVILAIIGFIGMNDVKPKDTVNDKKFTVKQLAKELLGNKAFVMFVIIYILFQGPTSSNAIYMPLLIKELGGTTTMVGTTLLLSTLSEMPAVLLTDKLMKNFSYKTLMVFACVLSIIRFAWYSTCPTPSMIMYMFFFQGTTSIIFILVAVRIIMDIVDERFVNSAYGISSMLAKGLSALLFQIISGQILNHFSGSQGYTIIYCIFAGSIMISLILALRFKIEKKKYA